MARQVPTSSPKRRPKVPPSDEATIKAADFVSALARGIEVLTLFSGNRPSITTSEVAELTGMSRAASRRSLLTLTALNYLQNDDETFRPLPKMLELGYAYLSTWGFRETVEPYLRGVVAKLAENCSFGVLDNGDVVYLARAEARRIVQSINMSVGTRVPAAVSAMGRVLLAGLPAEELDALLDENHLARSSPHAVADPTLFRERLGKVRSQGHCLVDGEFEPGLLSVAVPILSPAGEVIAAINVGAPSSRANPEHMLNVFLPVLKEAADAISTAFTMRSNDVKAELSLRIVQTA